MVHKLPRSHVQRAPAAVAVAVVQVQENVAADRVFPLVDVGHVRRLADDVDALPCGQGPREEGKGIWKA